MPRSVSSTIYIHMNSYLLYSAKNINHASLAHRLINYIDTKTKCCHQKNLAVLVFVNHLRSPGIDSQPGGIDFWSP
jgi:hypothetical protein